MNKRIFLFSLLFSILIPTVKIFYFSNQNVYLFQAYILNNPTILLNDWLSTTKDGNYIFSQFTFFLMQLNLHLPKFLNKVFEIIFFFFLLKIILENKKNDDLILMSIVLILSIISYYSGIGFSGIKNQHILGEVYQPSIFNVFFIPSIYFFLRKNFYLSVIFFAIPPLFHPSIIPTAMVLGFVYTLLTIRNDFKKTIFFLIFGILLILPSIMLALKNQLASPENLRVAHDILANFRVPHHSDISYLGKRDAVSFLILILGSLLCSNKDLKLILIFGTICIIISIVFLNLFDSNTLKLMFLHRLNVVLIPIAYLILIKEIYFFFDKKINLTILIFKFKKIFFSFFLLIIGFFFVISLNININANKKFTENSKLVESYSNNEKIWLVQPIKSLKPDIISQLRLNFSQPLFVDFKTHPYNPQDIIEWKKRIDLVDSFFNSKTTEEFKHFLSKILEVSRIDFILFSKSHLEIIKCKNKKRFVDNYILVNINDCIF
tara:strand:- start:1764 stop:3236 length:1473 start_codon:yes stop_codon:yes gene_type:complete